MKKRITVSMCSFLLLLAAGGQTWTGTLIDVACKQANAASKCDATGETKSFGLVTSDGKTVKFDEIGNAKTMAALEMRKGPAAGEKKASITGALEGDTIKVEAVQVH